MANKDSLIRKQLIVKYAKTQNGYKKEGLYGIILTLRGHSTERGSIHNQRYVTYLHKYILLSENMAIMRSVDLCIKGSVKSRAFCWAATRVRPRRLARLSDSFIQKYLHISIVLTI